MGILWIDKDRSVLRRRLKLGAVAGLAGVALAYGLAEFGREPEGANGSPASGEAGCCAAKHEQAGPSGGGSRPLPLQSQSTEAPRPPVPTTFDAAQAYRQARTYADCLTLNERDVQGVMSELEESREVDPSGALAARLEGEERQRREQCRRLGPNEYRQIDELMQQAARQGDPEARFFLLDRRVQTWVERAAAEREQGEAGQQPPDAMTAVSDVENMALQGYQPAMALAAQLLMSGLLVPADPVRATAWNVVALQRPGQEPLSRDDLADSGLVMALSAEEIDQVLRHANALRNACCRRRFDHDPLQPLTGSS